MMKKHNLDQEIRQSILTMPIQCEAGLLLQNDINKNIRETKEDQGGGEINNKEEVEDGDQGTGDEEDL